MGIIKRAARGRLEGSEEGSHSRATEALLTAALPVLPFSSESFINVRGKAGAGNEERECSTSFMLLLLPQGA